MLGLDLIKFGGAILDILSIGIFWGKICKYKRLDEGQLPEKLYNVIWYFYIIWTI